MEQSFHEMDATKEDKKTLLALRDNVFVFSRNFKEALSQIDFYTEIAIYLGKTYADEIAKMRRDLYDPDYRPVSVSEKFTEKAMGISDFILAQNTRNWHNLLPNALMMERVADQRIS